MGVSARQFVSVGVLLAALFGLFIAAESGQQRLADASRRVEAAALRHRVLSEILQLLTQAESGQRGYILVGEPSYLAPYLDALPKLATAEHRLDEVSIASNAGANSDVARIHQLSEVKRSEMAESLDLYHRRGRAAALELIRSELGKQTMTEITALIRRIEAEESSDIVTASRSWRDDLWITRWVTSGGLVLNVFLVLMVRRLVVRDLRNRERESAELTERGAELERIVNDRTEELSSLSTHLQSLAEDEKAALSRELHDELGGLLVAARMDVSWLEERIAASDSDVKAHFQRLHEALQTGVDVKRRVVENLRPTLLDNLGLITALRWQVSDVCGRAGLRHAESYADENLTLTPAASIAVFRIVQEALTNVLKHAHAQAVEVAVEERGDWLVVRIRDDGVGLPAERMQAVGSHGLAAMRHRATGLGGRWRVVRLQPRGTEIEVSLPLERVLAPAIV
jgi:signal transduction histidine kinase